MAKVDLGVNSVLPPCIRSIDSASNVTNKLHWRSSGISSRLRELCGSSDDLAIVEGGSTVQRSDLKERKSIYVVNDKRKYLLFIEFII